MKNHSWIRQDIQLTGIGRLQINVYDNSVGKPLSNVQVLITPIEDNNNILEELITNDNGQTATINLASPPEIFSNTNTNMPYSEYDIIASINGYKRTIIKGVQIFPNITAEQNIFLEPIVNGEETDSIIINPPTLWGEYPPKIPEEEIKELPPSLGFIVLPQPVIPEFIIVHAGAPDDKTAEDYKVPFKDYIKNVASSELYSTWPEETLRANILAIISFTLNRVYTEWYKSKGYNFTITGSSAYDQAFNYGRNIYSEVSTIVDELFTTFITKPDIRQPLFTQYCDGKKSTCPGWLSQWGSKDLGDQGYSAMDILKRYYGYDIFLMQADKVEGIPASFDGKNLQSGSRGPQVRTIQEQLNAINKNYPGIPKVRVDGLFGNDTRESVEIFQEVFKLPSTGIVDFKTWYKISEIYVAVTRMTEIL